MSRPLGPSIGVSHEAWKNASRSPVRRALGAGDADRWGVIMRGCVLGGRRRTSARAFGAAGVISLKNQGPSGTCGTRRSGVQRRRSQFAARPLGWSDLNRLLEQAGAQHRARYRSPSRQSGAPSTKMIALRTRTSMKLERREVWSAADRWITCPTEERCVRPSEKWGVNLAQGLRGAWKASAPELAARSVAHDVLGGANGARRPGFHPLCSDLRD